MRGPIIKTKASSVSSPFASLSPPKMFTPSWIYVSCTFFKMVVLGAIFWHTIFCCFPPPCAVSCLATIKLHFLHSSTRAKILQKNCKIAVLCISCPPPKQRPKLVLGDDFSTMSRCFQKNPHRSCTSTPPH